MTSLEIQTASVILVNIVWQKNFTTENEAGKFTA